MRVHQIPLMAFLCFLSGLPSYALDAATPPLTDSDMAKRPVEDEMRFAPLKEYGVLYGNPNKKWPLPSAMKGSLLDSLDGGFLIAKLISGTSKKRIICCRAELEILCKISAGRSNVRIRYEGPFRKSGYSGPKAPLLAESVSIDPALPCVFILRNGAFMESKLTRLREADLMFPAREGGLESKWWPTLYESPGIPDDALACMVMTPETFAIVKSRNAGAHGTVDLKTEKTDTSMIMKVTLNNDTIPELVLFWKKKFSMASHIFVHQGSIAALRKGTWYCHALNQHGQDGPEGY
jgi:hypothetical protein